MRDWLWLAKAGTPEDRATVEEGEVDAYVDERLMIIQTAVAEIREALFFQRGEGFGRVSPDAKENKFHE